MKLQDVLNQYQFSPEAAQVLMSSGIVSLYPPQAEAVEKGMLDGKNLVLSVPTAAGKTFVAELCMLKSILHKGGRCLYIAPLKALASEKYEDFKERYSQLGIKVGIATGDLDSPNKFLNQYQILIATAEKVDSLLRSRAKWLIDSLSVVVLDEIHFINDESRGPTMEILTARIKQLNPSVQLIALSATIKNAQEMADWLNAELVVSTWRPIPLKEGVFYNDQIMFDDGPSRLIQEQPVDDIGKLTLDTLKGKGQVLIFVNSRRSAQAASRQVAECSAIMLTEEERKELSKIAKEIAGPSADSTKVCRKLADVVICGAAFHHAGLKPKQRKLIENSFKKNLIKVICSTPTLAAGVNLPARRAIIRDCKRFESGVGAAYIPASEYKQCAGRAGRPQYDEYGEAILIAKTMSEAYTLFERYIHAGPDPVISKLGTEAALRIHVLSSVAGGYVNDINGMFDFISHTFLAHQKKTYNLIEMLGQIFEFLEREKFIEKNGFRYFATAFGNITSRLYIDPLSAIILRDGLKKVHDGKSFSSIGLIHLMCCCPDGETLKVGKSDFVELESFGNSVQDELILTPADTAVLEDFYTYLSTLKTTWMLTRWIEEEKEDAICDDFGIGPGDVYRHVEATDWLLYGSGVIADLFNFKKLTFVLEDLRNRIHYGIKEELLELAQLKGVGRVRARNLFKKGYKKFSDLKFTTVDELSQVNQIGRNLAQEIIDQVNGARKRKSRVVAEEEPAPLEFD